MRKIKPATLIRNPQRYHERDIRLEARLVPGSLRIVTDQPGHQKFEHEGKTFCITDHIRGYLELEPDLYISFNYVNVTFDVHEYLFLACQGRNITIKGTFIYQEETHSKIRIETWKPNHEIVFPVRFL